MTWQFFRSGSKAGYPIVTSTWHSPALSDSSKMSIGPDRCVGDHLDRLFQIFLFHFSLKVPARRWYLKSMVCIFLGGSSYKTIKEGVVWMMEEPGCGRCNQSDQFIPNSSRYKRLNWISTAGPSVMFTINRNGTSFTLGNSVTADRHCVFANQNQWNNHENKDGWYDRVAAVSVQ